jgi:hypothetical protein
MLVSMRVNMSEDSLKRYFDNLAEANVVPKEESNELFEDFKTKLHFKRGTLALYKDTNISPAKVRKIAESLEKSEQFDNLLNTM